MKPEPDKPTKPERDFEDWDLEAAIARLQDEDRREAEYQAAPQI
jgi:hypothetical protein